MARRVDAQVTQKIEFDSVQLCRGGRVVLDEVTFTLTPGRMTALVGANGSGKSTLLAGLAGDVPLTQGVLRVHGQHLERNDVVGQARWRAVMHQHASFEASLTAREIIEIGLHAFQDLGLLQRRALLEQAARLADVQSWLGRNVTTLSGGQQQRVQLARALVQTLAVHAGGTRPGWLLLDEPVSNQDPWQQQRTLHMCRQLCADTGVGVLVALHDLSLVRQWCDDLVVLSDGQVAAHGDVDQVLSEAVIRRSFGAQINVHYVDSPVRAVVLWSAFGEDKAGSDGAG